MTDDNIHPFPPQRRRRTPPPPPPGGWPEWHARLRKDNGRVIPDLANALIALRGERAFLEAFAFDDMLKSVKALAPPPIGAAASPGPPTPRLAAPEDYSRTQEWLQTMGLPRIGRDVVQIALELIAHERTIHPLREWLIGLEWDGVPRIGRFLHLGLGCPDDEYHRQIGAMFLISMVARVMHPGCQCDYMIVLEGPQGELKSRFCRMLAGDDYFSDNLPGLNTDHIRISMHLRGKWLIEISELSAFSRAEASTLKAFLTRREEIYTPKHGRAEVCELRQGVFVGTTNDDQWIKDDTGGRRFWPVAVIRVDLDWLEAARAQLFAEAVEAYHIGRQYWPDREFERAVIAPVQADRQLYDDWTDAVLRAAASFGRVVTIAEIFEDISGTYDSKIGGKKGGNLDKLDQLKSKRIAAILKKDGYKRGQGDGGRKVWRKD